MYQFCARPPPSLTPKQDFVNEATLKANNINMINLSAVKGTLIGIAIILIILTNSLICFCKSVEFINFRTDILRT